VREAHGRSDLAFQIGMPSGLGMAMFAMGPPGPLVHRRPFTDAIAREITQIRADAGDDVIVQLELPAELAFVTMTPGPLRAAPPSLDPAFYAALAALRLPAHTRFVAGLLHEDRSADELRVVVSAVERALGRTVDLAASCGLGRRPREMARLILRQGAQLCGPVVDAP
jgi:hypothetical protein